MKDNPNGRPDSAADIARLVHQLYQQGLRLIANCEHLAGFSAAHDRSAFDAAMDDLLGQMRGQVDAAFRQLEDQTRSLYIPHETFLAAVSQLNSLQDMIHGPLNQVEMGWLAALPTLVPRLGAFQHKQERLQATAEALAELRAAQDAYLALARKTADEAIVGFQQLTEQQQRPELTLKDIYDLWLCSGERAYERMLESEAYSLALARVANSSAVVTEQAQDSLDDVLNYFKLPTRREMITTQQRLHELRRRQRAAERAVPAEISTLRREMAELRAEMEKLRQPIPAHSHETSPKGGGGRSNGKRRRHAYQG